MRFLPIMVASLALLGAACGGPAPEPEAAAPGRAAAGQELFSGRMNCTSCHGSGGRGGVGPALAGREFEARHPTDETIARQIREGGGGMPAYSPERMSERELRDVVAYIRWLNERNPD